MMKVFESVSSHPGLHPDPEGAVPVGGKLPFFGVLLVLPEDEVAYFEFSFDDFLAVAMLYPNFGPKNTNQFFLSCILSHLICL